MTKLVVEWDRKSVSDAESRPMCPYCKEVYPDNAIFDIKNYPADWMAAIFFNCENCNKEAKFTIEWCAIQAGEYEEETPEIKAMTDKLIEKDKKDWDRAINDIRTSKSNKRRN